MNKKAIAILGAIFLLIVGTLGFLIYAKYGGKKTTPAPVAVIPASTSTPATASSTPPVATPPPNQQFTKLLSSQVVSPILFYNGQGVSYFDPSGQLYQAALQSGGGVSAPQFANPQALNVQTKSDISEILWPPAGDNFIAESDSGSQRVWSFYNSQTRSYTDLPPQVEAFDWLPSGQQIYYIWLDSGKAALNIGDGDTNNWKYIADMWEQDDALSVSPDGRNILYYERNTATSTNPINLVTPDGKIWKTLISTGINYGVLWSPDSQKFLFGKKDSTGSFYQLWYYNLLTGQVSPLYLNTTVNKVVWGKDSQTIYAAVPLSGIAGSGNLTTDSFYKYNTQTGDKQQYDPGSTAIDGENLFLNSDGSGLFFKNAQDGGLYDLNLNQ